MIIEINEDFYKLDKFSQDIILQEYYEDMIEEGISEENAKLQIDMIKWEL